MCSPSGDQIDRAAAIAQSVLFTGCKGQDSHPCSIRLRRASGVGDVMPVRSQGEVKLGGVLVMKHQQSTPVDVELEEVIRVARVARELDARHRHDKGVPVPE